MPTRCCGADLVTRESAVRTVTYGRRAKMVFHTRVRDGRVVVQAWHWSDEGLPLAGTPLEEVRL